MNSHQQIANWILWSAAIIVSAILNNSAFSVYILSGIAISSILLTNGNRCRWPRRSPAS